MNTFEFIPKTCQWIDEDDLDGKCRLPTIVGKSYCEGHYHMAYQTSAPDDEEFDKQAEKELEALKDAADPIIEE